MHRKEKVPFNGPPSVAEQFLSFTNPLLNQNSNKNQFQTSKPSQKSLKTSKTIQNSNFKTGKNSNFLGTIFQITPPSLSPESQKLKLLSSLACPTALMLSLCPADFMYRPGTKQAHTPKYNSPYSS